MTPIETPLTTGEVAQRYGVTNSSVRRWAKNGRIASFKTPTGQLRVLPSEVEAMIAETAAERGAEQKASA
jgi:excisionase family DNA binding protein